MPAYNFEDILTEDPDIALDDFLEDCDDEDIYDG